MTETHRQQAPTKRPEVAVIGGAGHVGLGMCLVLANSGFNVQGVDIDEERNSLIMSGVPPFMEEQAEDYLRRALAADALHMTSDLAVTARCPVIVVVVGTPVDEHLNPVLRPLDQLMREMAPHLTTGKAVILRSTVSPGTTDHLKRVLEKETKLKVPEDICLVYAPERTMQGKTISELSTLPQLVGSYDDGSFSRVSEFFSQFSSGANIRLTPIEAEIGKLITNMTRYVTLALANEYYMIGNSFGVSINRVIDACNQDYPRLALPSPGPNVGGPCLYKDGWFLVERISFPDLIGTAFRINEGMPMEIAQILGHQKDIHKVAILGATFKANSDDTRNSLSFKLFHQLDRLGYERVLVEPNLPDYDPMESIQGSDAVVLMTPHQQFKDLARIRQLVDKESCLYVDIWGFWAEMRHRSRNGLFAGHEVPA